MRSINDVASQIKILNSPYQTAFAQRPHSTSHHYDKLPSQFGDSLVVKDPISFVVVSRIPADEVLSVPAELSCQQV